MLGRLGMTIEECLEQYKQDMMDVFPKWRGWFKYGRWAFLGAKWDVGPLEGAIKELIRKRLKSEDASKDAGEDALLLDH
jgi:hypothetical protein